jgi:hypothetical protein
LFPPYTPGKGKDKEDVMSASKPANATWVAKAKVSADDPSIDFPLEQGGTHPLGEVDLAWYDQGRLKISIAHGTPGVIRQAYLTGADRDLVIEVAPRD